VATELPAPVLAYDRITANRRNTCLLLAVFAALLLPLVYGAGQNLSFFVAIIATAGKPVDPHLLYRLDPHTEIMVFLSAPFLLAAAIASFCHWSGSLFLIQQLGARRVRREQDPDLCRAVENLCIGAGLPSPALYVIETRAPNAFAIGRNPKNASLAVTRGLLRLLDRRELAGVLAHELSHIGNRDTALNTLLAALVGTVMVPLKIVTGLNPQALALLLISALFAAPFIWGFLGFVLFDVYTYGLTTRMKIALLTPAYALFVAPPVALMLRRMMSEQREFLADADAALLTRDPEGLALALAKIGAARGAPIEAGAATAHMYFVDPIDRGASGKSSSHPSIDARINLLAKMGDGITQGELAAALDAGTRYLVADADRESGNHDKPVRGLTFNGQTAPGTQFRLTDDATPLYEKPDGWSTVIEQLSAGTIVTFDHAIGHFARVSLDRLAGYIPCGTGAQSLR